MECQQPSLAHIVCIEVKTAEKWDRKWERPMRSLYAHDGIHIEQDDRCLHWQEGIPL